MVHYWKKEHVNAKGRKTPSGRLAWLALSLSAPGLERRQLVQVQGVAMSLCQHYKWRDLGMEK